MAICLPDDLPVDESLKSHIAAAVAPASAWLLTGSRVSVPPVGAVFALFPTVDTLHRLAAAVRDQRQGRDDGYPVLVVGLAPHQLTEFGRWLAEAAPTGEIEGLRLIVGQDPAQVLDQLADHLQPVYEPNVIAMPVSGEIDTPRIKYFYCLSPELRELLAYLAELAENNVSRIYLLGGPGAGKTSLAYYFHLCRKLGNFVTVNLTAEATHDKAAMKSLLCGHVSGAFPGAGSRTGAFSHARDGVCFLDESHGVSGTVMEVLMEALDSNQYLPYGASAKRPLDCAIVFASNRSWETLIASVNMDEHARLGAQILHLPDLAVRREDLVAVLAATLHQMKSRSTSWVAPAGLSRAAWQAMCACPWRGNTRALIRVIETAFVTAATERASLIERHAVEAALALWEPSTHASHDIYTRAGR
ncbi:putative PAS/PAC sensor protein [Salinisphaera sp. T31B1]